MKKITKLPQIGTRVKGVDECSKNNNYTGTVRSIDTDRKYIHIERDDGKEGAGRNYKDKHMWVSKYTYRKCFSASMGNGTLYLLAIENWKERLK